MAKNANWGVANEVQMDFKGSVLNLFANVSSFLEMKLLILTLNIYLDIVVICYLHVAHFSLVIVYKNDGIKLNNYGKLQWECLNNLLHNVRGWTL